MNISYDQALIDFSVITRMGDAEARRYAKANVGEKLDRTWTAGEVAHLVIKKTYGEAIYKRVRRAAFRRT